MARQTGKRESGNPARRAAEKARTKTPRNQIDVGVDRARSLVTLDVGGRITGMTVTTCDALIESLTNARDDLRSHEDRRPHSRACGIENHAHGKACSPDCPTCGGDPLKAAVPE